MVVYSRSFQWATEYPGVAKFGIALEWGSRGLEFESQHSDHDGISARIFRLFLFCDSFPAKQMFFCYEFSKLSRKILRCFSFPKPRRVEFAWNTRWNGKATPNIPSRNIRGFVFSSSAKTAVKRWSDENICEVWRVLSMKRRAMNQIIVDKTRYGAVQHRSGFSYFG